MAEWENPLGGGDPLVRALMLAMKGPDAVRPNPLMHPESFNQFALPPKEPRAEVRNSAPRPGDYMSPVSEALSPTMGAYGLGNALGETYTHAREGDWKGAASPLAEVLLSMAPIPGMKGIRPPRVENPIRAYHGSPHDFDKFDLSKVGTGQGASATGRGVNLAANEELAMKYRDLLSAPKGSEPMLFEARSAKAEAGGNLDRAEAILRERLAGPDLDEATRYLHKEPGHMYEVAIHATPDQFLNLDSPLYKQPGPVQEALKSLGVWREPKGFTVEPSKNGDKWTARNAYGAVIGTYKDKARAEAAAQKRMDDFYTGAGTNAYTQLGGNTIYGALDSGSAAERLMSNGVVGTRASTGTPNDRFVVFNPELIEILRKYGLLGPVALGAAANSLGNDGKQ